ncbi:MAG: hypothetical protein ABJA90_03080 [Ginsengibacter sp.]
MVYFLFTCFFSSFTVHAQVAVSKEPRHHLIFENDKVRVLNVEVPPGDTTQYHVHSTPSVFIPFTNTYTGSQRINERPEYNTSVAGNVWYEDLSEPHIKVHRVWNLDTSVFHVMDIELLANNKNFVLNPQPIAHTHLLIDTPWARVYSVQLEKNEIINFTDQPSDFILISIDTAEIKLIANQEESIAFIRPGQYYWINAGDKFSVINRRDVLAKFILVSLR